MENKGLWGEAIRVFILFEPCISRSLEFSEGREESFFSINIRRICIISCETFRWLKSIKAQLSRRKIIGSKHTTLIKRSAQKSVSYALRVTWRVLSNPSNPFLNILSYPNLTHLMASGNYLSISSIELVIKVNM